MPITVGHSKSITVADGTNTGIVRPSDWNSNHAVTLNISGTDIFGAFSNAGNVTFGTNTAGYITATAPAGGGAGDGGNVIAAGGSTANSTGTIVFSNSNGVSFGLNGGTVTGSHNGYTGATTQFLTTAQPVGAYLTTARASNDAIGLNTALTANGVSVTANSSGLSLNFPAFLTTAANSTHSHGNPTLNLTNLSGTTASNSAGFTLSLSAAAGGGGADGYNSAQFTNSTANSTMPIVWAGNSGGSGNVTMGLTGSTVTMSAPNPAGVSASWYAVLNTTGGASSMTFAPNVVSIIGQGYASVGENAGNFAISVGAQTANLYGVGNTTLSSSMNTSLALLSFAGSGGASVGMSNGSVVISAPTGGGGGVTLSKWAWPNLQFNNQTQQFLQSTFAVWPLMAEEISFNWIRFAKSVSLASTSFASTANTTFSFNQAETHRLVLYSRGTGASSQSLQSVMSTSASIGYSLNVYYGSATNTSQGHSMGITFPVSDGTSSFSTQYNTSNLSTFAINTGNNTRLTGMKMFDIGWSTSLSNGEYWAAYNVTTASTTQGTNLSGARLLMSNIGMSMPNNTIGLFGNANNASIQWQSGIGSFTTVGGATTASMGFSNVSSSASHVIPHMSFLRI